MTGSTRETGFAVIGGGIVGASVAYGLAKAGEDVLLLDEGDKAFRASNGNFGLVWVQAKGGILPAYAPWALKARHEWSDFPAELLEATGIDVEPELDGGLFICFTEEELSERKALLDRLSPLAPDFNYEVLPLSEARKHLKHLTGVAGATWSRLDGACNPMKLLRALLAATRNAGGVLLTGGRVTGLTQQSGGWKLDTLQGTVLTEKVVFAAGLGNKALCAEIGFDLPVKPVRGQILVSERHPRMIEYPTELVRQTRDGTFMMGGSWEDVGFDTGNTLEATRRIAGNGVKAFPFLRDVKLVRSWGALRIMAPDMAPVYDELAPGAFLVTCHSGVSLSAIHSRRIADWIRAGTLSLEAADFTARRFATN